MPMTTPPSNISPSPFPNRRSPLMKLGMIGLSLIAFSISCVAIAPTLLSTKRGTDFICKLVNKNVGSTLQIESMKLSWLGTQQINSLSYSDAASRMFFSCQKIYSDATLVSILFKNSFGDTNITSAHLKIKKDLVAKSFLPPQHIQRGSLSFIPIITPDIQQMLLPVMGRFNIIDSSIDLMSSNIPSISIKNIESTLFIAKNLSVASLTLSATSSAANKEGSISFTGQLNNEETFNPQLTISSSITNLPVRIIEQAATLINPKMKGALTPVFGEFINCEAKTRLTRSDASLTFDASSDAFNAHIATVTSGGKITLQEPARMLFSISKPLADQFLQGYSLPLNGPVKVAVNIPSMQIPVGSTGISTETMELHAAIDLSAIQLQNANQTPFTLGSTKITFDTQDISKDSSISLLSVTGPQAINSYVKISGLLSNILSDTPTGNINVQLANVDTALINTIANTPFAAATLGPSVSGTIALSLLPDTSNAALTLTAPYLSIQNANINYTGALELLDPCTIVFSPTNTLYQILFGPDHVTASTPSTIQLNIEKLSIPSFKDLSAMQVKASILSPSLSFDKLFAFAPYSLENISTEITIAGYKSISVNLESSLLSFDLEGAYIPSQDVIDCRKGINAKYLLTDEQIKSLFQNRKRPHLVSPAQASIYVEPMKVPLSIEALSKTSCKSSIECSEIEFQNQKGVREGRFDQTKMLVDFKGKDKTVTLLATSTYKKQLENSAKVDLNLSASSFIDNNTFTLDKASVVADLALQDMPSSIFDVLFGNKTLPIIIGNTFNLKAHIQNSPSIKEFSFSAKSDAIDAQANIGIENNILVLKDRLASISYTLSPDAQQDLEKMLSKKNVVPRLLLSQDAVFLFEISKLSIPFNTSTCDDLGNTCLSIGYKDSLIQGKVSNYNLKFTDTISNESIFLKSAIMAFSKDKGPKPLYFDLFAEANTSTAKAFDQGGSLDVKAQIGNIYTDGQDLDFSHLSSKIAVDISKLPSSVIDLFARTFGDQSSTFSSIFGPSITASAELSLQDASGPLKLNVNSQSTRASVVGKLTNGILTLDEPIYAQVTVTPELSRYVLEGVNPLSITEILSDNPITLEVQPSGFSLPLTHFTMDKVNIPTARLELGQVQCKNEGNLSIALTLLKSIQLSQNNYLNLWFTPVDIHIIQGVVDVERTDILIADTFNICLWGMINPIINQVDMTLGLTSDCLAKAFAIKNLPSDYVLQIPMTGSLSDVKINTTKATAKIAALLAWQQATIAGGKAAGPAGQLFGQFMNKLGSLPLNDKDTPPAKKPFPWEMQQEQNPNKEPRRKDKKTHFKRSDKPLKQIFKMMR